MPDLNQQDQNQFIIEKIKERPINRKKLLRRSLITAGLAVVFGLIACVTFLVLQPLISSFIYPEEKPQIVAFPEDEEEMSPEEMLTDIMEQQGQQTQEPMAEKNTVTIDYEQFMGLLQGEKLDLNSYNQIYNAVEEYAWDLYRSMVTVTSTSSDVDVLDNVRESTDQSFGVIIADNSVELLILTAYDNIKEADLLTATFRNGHSVTATVKQYDKETNLAVLAVALSRIPQNVRDLIELAPLGSSSIEKMQGTPVIALGNIMGTGEGMGYGIIAGQSMINGQDANYKLLMTDIYGSEHAQGVLFNMRGSIVGMICNVSTQTDMENLIVAYGISDLRGIVEKMSNGKAITMMGISGMDVSEDAINRHGVPKGAYVTDVTMDSPAMLAGILPGDVVVELNGQTIESLNGYTKALLQAEPGQSIEVMIMRQSQDEYKEMKFTIMLDAREK